MHTFCCPRHCVGRYLKSRKLTQPVYEFPGGRGWVRQWILVAWILLEDRVQAAGMPSWNTFNLKKKPTKL